MLQAEAAAPSDEWSDCGADAWTRVARSAYGRMHTAFGKPELLYESC
jgi:hypothetical protein